MKIHGQGRAAEAVSTQPTWPLFMLLTVGQLEVFPDQEKMSD